MDRMFDAFPRETAAFIAGLDQSYHLRQAYGRLDNLMRLEAIVGRN